MNDADLISSYSVFLLIFVCFTAWCIFSFFIIIILMGIFNNVISTSSLWDVRLEEENIAKVIIGVQSELRKIEFFITIISFYYSFFFIYFKFISFSSTIILFHPAKYSWTASINIAVCIRDPVPFSICIISSPWISMILFSI